MSKCLLIALILISFSVNCLSQSELLNKGENGLFLVSNYVTGDDASGLSGGVSFSYKGLIDFGITYGDAWLNEQSEYLTLNWNTVQLSMNLLLFRYRADTTFFGLGFGLSYAYQTYHLSYIYFEEIISEDFNGNLILPSIGAYLNTYLSNTISLQYLVSLGFLAGDTENSKVSVAYESWVFSTGINLAYKPSPVIILFLSPTISLDKNDITFGANLGISFITNK